MNMNTNTQIAERADLIISHVVDGEATTQEWHDFEALALVQPRMWQELAHAQPDAGALRGGLTAASVVADRVSLPANAVVQSAVDERVAEVHAYQHPQLRLNRLGAWTGWAAAAIITIIAAVQLKTHQVGSEANLVPTGLSGPMQTSADAWKEYLNLGKQDGSVLGEMPGRVLVESRPVPQGQGFEVVFIRQVMERRVGPDLYEVTGRDEAGKPTLAPVKPTVRGTM